MKQERKFSRFVKITATVVLVCTVLALVGVAGAWIYASNNVDYSLDEALFAAAGKENVTRLYAKTDGEAVCVEEVYLSDTQKTFTSFSDISDTVKEVFLAAEDRTFYRHHGVNLGRTAYAAFTYLTSRAPSFGASTLTQQTVKNISGDSAYSVKRKLTEMLRAFHMEHEHTKDEIFELYLNILPMSENVTGIGSAAITYFDKTPAELSYAEAATLAGIANAPTKYNPYLHPEACLEKRNRVLYAVMDAGYIDKETYEAACLLPLGVSERKAEQAQILSWFAETVLKDIETDLVAQGMTPDAAHRYVSLGGLSVETTVNPEIQAVLEEAFSSVEAEDGLSFAFCVCDSQTGDLAAIVGQSGQKTGNFLSNYATDIPHAPGSALKPLALYAPLLEEKKIHAATVFDDVPVSFFETGETSVAFPKNSPAVYQGLTTVSEALCLSKNTVAVRLYQLRGPQSIYHSLKNDFGFTTLVRQATAADGRQLTDLAVSPLALGQLTYGVSLRALTAAYTVFPSEGVLTACRSYTRVWDRDGNLVLEKEASPKRVFSADTARLMNQWLSGVVSAGTAQRITLKNRVNTAGKTGTSGDSKDKWFIGYTPYYTAGIWCGYDCGDRSVCGNDHLLLWDEIMTKIHASQTAKKEPLRTFSTQGLIRCPYCKDSGGLFTPTCAKDPRGDRLAYAYFTPDNCPTQVCSCHIPVAYDTLTKAVAGEGCPSDYVSDISLLRLPTRDFPIQIIVSDAEYGYRPVAITDRRGDSYDIPFYAYTLPEGHFCGRAAHSKQFNSFCYLHDDEPYSEDSLQTSSA